MQLLRTSTLCFALAIYVVLFPMVCAAKVLDGVVVDAAASHSGTSAKGIKPGDLILSWSGGDTHGKISSPFDLLALERGEAPKGFLNVEGRRGAQEQRWQFGPDDWDIGVRPRFKSAESVLFRKAKSVIQRGEVLRARVLWREIAARNPQDRWLYSWCAWDAAEWAADHHQWRLSDRLFRQAVDNAEEQPVIQAFLLHAWALAFEQSEDWNKVRGLLQKAVSSAEAAQADSLLVAYFSDELGKVANWQRDTATAEDSYNYALGIQRRFAPKSLATARSLVGLAIGAMGRSDDAAAESLLKQSESITAEVAPAGVDSAVARIWLAHLAERKGALAVANQYLDQAQTNLSGPGETSNEFAQLLSLRALIELRQGDLNDAELQLRQGSMIYKTHPTDPTVGIHLRDELGILAYESSDFATARKYALETDEILSRLAPVSMDRGGCLMNLGLYAMEDGDSQKATTYLQRALAIIEKRAPQTLDHAKLLTFLTELEVDDGDYAKAAQYTSQAQAILGHVGARNEDMAWALDESGQIARHNGELDASENYYRSGIAIAGQFAPQSEQHAELLAGYAETLAQKNEPEHAASEYQLAIDALESQLSRLGGTESSRSGFRAHHNAIYTRYIDLLVSQGKADQAFEVLERSRARTLLEMLAQANINIRAHVSTALLAQQDRLRKEFSDESNRRLRLLNREHTEEQINASDRKIAALLAKFSELEAEIRDSNPGYAELTQPDTTTVQDVQERLLDPNTLLLEYSLGETHSYLWAIGTNSVSVHQLPGRAEIDELARRVHEFCARQSAEQNKPGSGNPAVELSRILLRPVAHELGNKRLLIVADGVLNYVPFAALPEPQTGSAGELLVTRHEIIALPSASVLLTMRKERLGRQSPTRQVAVLADPVFTAADPRVKRPRSAVRAAVAPGSVSSFFGVERSIELTQRLWGRDLGVTRTTQMMFPRLTYSRYEAQAIVATVPPGQSLEALDFKASRTEAMSPELAKYKILHFATHGVLDTNHPEFSGLLFSLVDQHGQPQVGLLSLEDIYNLNLPVDMVVLSACDTALGKEVNGEGIIGLTRGFMYAGASRVVASLWKVNDVATAQLMAYFYRAMEKEHLPAAAALRKAQLQMSTSRKWSAPYYWAGFQLQGEWK